MFDFDTNDIAEMEEEIRATAKIAVRTLEIFYEELQKSNLPENVKMAIMADKAKQ